VNLAFHDAEFASVGSSGLAHGIFRRALPVEPYLWHPCRFRASCHAISRTTLSPKRLGRFLRPSVKRGRRSRPGMPSIVEGHSRSRVSRCRSRVAVTCVSASIRPSSPLRGSSLRPGLRHAAGVLRARPPSPPAPLTMFTREIARASLGQADAQRLLQLHIRRADTLPSVRFSLKTRRGPTEVGAPNPAFASVDAYYGVDGLPLSKEDGDRCEP